MGFADFFKNLFGKKYVCQFAPEQIDINITGSMIIVNGNKIEIPCHLDSLKVLFGKARKDVAKSGENVKYAWDNLGVYCYARKNNVVHCFAIKTKHNPEMELSSEPKSLFKGKLSIKGEPWEQVMFEGEDMEDFGKERTIDNLSLFAEYADFENADSNGCEGAYTGVEIELGD